MSDIATPTEELSVEDSIRKFETLLTLEQRKAIERRINKIRNYSPKVGVFGKTGAGKSSLCNALFGAEKTAVSNDESCTRELTELTLGDEEGSKIILVDAPGICEDQTHLQYVDLYRQQLAKLDLVLWVVGVRDRALSPDVEFYKTHMAGKDGMPPFVLVLNQVDIAAPGGWDEKHRVPSAAQRDTIEKRKQLLSDQFGVAFDNVVAVSADQGFGLIPLVNRVVDILPKEKKLAFVDKVEAEKVSPEARVVAERGFFESAMSVVKDVLGTIAEHKETIAWMAQGAIALFKLFKKK